MDEKVAASLLGDGPQITNSWGHSSPLGRAWVLRCQPGSQSSAASSQSSGVPAPSWEGSHRRRSCAYSAHRLGKAEGLAGQERGSGARLRKGRRPGIASRTFWKRQDCAPSLLFLGRKRGCRAEGRTPVGPSPGTGVPWAVLGGLGLAWPPSRGES